MLGVIKPESGVLFADCGKCRIPFTQATRKLFAYVPQGNLLISGTLRENLTIVRPNATEEEIQKAIYVSAMDEYLAQLPMGLETVLGENSAGLSEGQAQRLAIARAVLSDAPILLLDEGTSALDARTERVVLERIRQLQDRTCIVVTHRQAAIDMCNWKIKIDNKEIQTEKV